MAVPGNIATNVGIPGGAPQDVMGVVRWMTQFAISVNTFATSVASAVNYLLGNVRVTTVANLGTPTLGLRAMVTDATATTFASVVVKGGTNTVPVYATGKVWLIG